MSQDYNDDFYEAVDDMDADIKQKEELIEEVKNIQDSEDWNETQRVINDLKRRWRRIRYSESAYEETLRDEFEKLIDALYAKRTAIFQKNEKLKSALIKEAEEVSQSEQWQVATKKMTELMNQWKKVGPAGRETDDSLWERFNGARQTFYDRKHEHWEKMNEKFAEVRGIKQELIEKAKELQDSEQWKETSEKYRGLMEEWKKAGNAGREYEDALWQDFCAARQVFFDRRNAYYDELHARQQENFEKKKELIEQAKLMVETNSFTRENTQTMKNLSNQWKEIGSCGREKENQIWPEFRQAMDTYFDGLRAFNDQKHVQWEGRMKDAKVRKQEQINNQKRQIERLTDDMNGLVSESNREEIAREIEEKQDFIAQLEAEIKDIDEKLAE